MTDNSEIPIINIAPLMAGEDAGATVDAIAAACRDFGFFQITGHGLSDQQTAKMLKAAFGFFALPQEIKRRLERGPDSPMGYFDRELTKQMRDQKEVFDFHGEDDRVGLTVDGPNQWPDEATLPDYRATMLDWFAACEAIGLKIMEAFCRGLGEAPDRLHRHFQGRHTSFVRLNHYPLSDVLAADEAAATTPLGDMALHHHTDAGVLTILLQDDVGGLEVHQGGRWIAVPPTPGALVINIGDMIQVWSNDIYKAALHRVRQVRGAARLSVPFFYNPAFDTEVAPLASVSEAGARYNPIRWGEFRQKRAGGDYADYGTEVQISDYAIRE